MVLVVEGAVVDTEVGVKAEVQVEVEVEVLEVEVEVVEVKVEVRVGMVAENAAAVRIDEVDRSRMGVGVVGGERTRMRRAVMSTMLEVEGFPTAWFEVDEGLVEVASRAFPPPVKPPAAVSKVGGVVEEGEATGAGW